MRILQIYDVSNYVHVGMVIPPYKNFSSYGFPLGGVKYFLKYLVEDLAQNKNSVVCFDSKTRKSYPGYKAKRLHDPSIEIQLEFLYDTLLRCGIHCLKVDGYEADDLIATCSKLACESGQFDRIYIMSDDSDNTHNVNNIVSQLAVTSNGRDIDAKNYSDTVIIGHHLLLNTTSFWKVLHGCKSDNIPAFSGSMSNRDIYKYFIDVCNIALVGKIDLISSRAAFNACISQLSDLSASDLIELKQRADIIYPDILENVPLKFSNINTIHVENLTKILSIVRDINSLKKFKLEPVTVDNSDIEFFKNSARKLKNGEFSVDNDMPIFADRIVNNSIPLASEMRSFT